MQKHNLEPITNPPLFEFESAFDPAGPYGDALGGFSLTSGPARRPTLNGALLINPSGTVWLVVNGQARGYLTWDLLMRLHDNYPKFPNFSPGHVSWVEKRVFGITPPPPYPDIKKFFTRVMSIDFIEEASPWSESVRLVWAEGQPQAIYNFEGGRGVLYGMPSGIVRDVHKLSWAKSTKISVEEFTSYEMIVIEPTAH